MENNDDLIKKPLPGLIRSLAVPASIGFFFNTMYNVVDTYFAGLVSTTALAALSISFPVYFVIIAFGFGIATGANALIANSLGAGKTEEAQKYSMQSLMFSILISLILMIVGWIFSPSLFRLLGASGEYLQIATSYTNIIFLSSVFFGLTFVINSILNSQGDTKTFRNFLIVGFFLNLVLNPAFMFGWGPLPALGLSGVAWATFFIQIIGVLYMGYRAMGSDIICRGCWGMLMPKLYYFKKISAQSFPASLNMMTVALGIFIITYFIKPFGQAAIAAYGIATRIDQVALLPLIGLNIATLTLVGQNNGAKKFSRVMRTCWLCLRYGAVLAAIATIIVFLIPRQLMYWFSSDPEVIDIGAVYLRISALIYISYMILYIVVSTLQGIKKPMYAIWIGLYRQILMPIIIFPLFISVFAWGLVGIWWGIFFINWSAAIVSVLYTRFQLNKLGSQDHTG